MEPEQRFWKYVEKTDTCWNWTAYKGPTGYGTFNINGKTHLAHRVSLRFAGIELQPGLVVDHICRNRACVNPEHLRQVTQRENVLENSESVAAKNAKKTHCPKNHPYAYGRRGNKKCPVCEAERRRLPPPGLMPRSLGDDEMKNRICAECGSTFQVADNERGKPKLFCCEAHKQVHANRRTSRGKSLVAIAQAWRKARGSGDMGKFFFQELCGMLDEFNAQDAKANRMDPVDYAKLLCGYYPVNPDYNGGRTFEANRWFDRLDANR